MGREAVQGHDLSDKGLGARAAGAGPLRGQVFWFLCVATHAQDSRHCNRKNPAAQRARKNLGAQEG